MKIDMFYFTNIVWLQKQFKGHTVRSNQEVTFCLRVFFYFYRLVCIYIGLNPPPLLYIEIYTAHKRI